MNSIPTVSKATYPLSGDGLMVYSHNMVQIGKNALAWLGDFSNPEFQSFPITSQGTITDPFQIPTDQSSFDASTAYFVGVDGNGNVYLTANDNDTGNPFLYQCSASGAILQNLDISNTSTISVYPNTMALVWEPYSGGWKIAILGSNTGGTPSGGYCMIVVDVASWAASYTIFGKDSTTAPETWTVIGNGNNFICADNNGNFYVVGLQTDQTTNNFEIVSFFMDGSINWDNVYAYTGGVYPYGILGTQENNLLLMNTDNSVSLIKSTDYTAVAVTTPDIGPGEEGFDLQFAFGTTDQNNYFYSLTQNGVKSTFNLISGTDLSTKVSYSFDGTNGVTNVMYVPLLNSFTLLDGTSQLNVYYYTAPQVLSNLLRIPVPSTEEQCLPEGRCLITGHCDFTFGNTAYFNSQQLNQLGKWTEARAINGYWNGADDCVITVIGTNQTILVLGSTNTGKPGTMFLSPLFSQMPLQLQISTRTGATAGQLDFVIANYDVQTPISIN